MSFQICFLFRQLAITGRYMISWRFRSNPISGRRNVKQKHKTMRTDWPPINYIPCYGLLPFLTGLVTLTVFCKTNPIFLKSACFLFFNLRFANHPNYLKTNLFAFFQNRSLQNGPLAAENHFCVLQITPSS